MRACKIIVVASLAIFSATACHQHQKAKALSEKDIAAIHGVASAYEKALLAGDWDAWTGLFAEDFKYLVPNFPIVEGRAAVKNMIKEAKPFPEASIKVVQVEGLDKMAVARGTYMYAMAQEAVGVPMKDSGKFLWMLKKTNDGKWEVAIECYNSDLPLPKQ